MEGLKLKRPAKWGEDTGIPRPQLWNEAGAFFVVGHFWTRCGPYGQEFRSQEVFLLRSQELLQALNADVETSEEVPALGKAAEEEAGHGDAGSEIEKAAR